MSNVREQQSLISELLERSGAVADRKTDNGHQYYRFPNGKFYLQRIVDNHKNDPRAVQIAFIELKRAMRDAGYEAIISAVCKKQKKQNTSRVPTPKQVPVPKQVEVSRDPARIDISEDARALSLAQSIQHVPDLKNGQNESDPAMTEDIQRKAEGVQRSFSPRMFAYLIPDETPVTGNQSDTPAPSPIQAVVVTKAAEPKPQVAVKPVAIAKSVPALPALATSQVAPPIPHRESASDKSKLGTSVRSLTADQVKFANTVLRAAGKEAYDRLVEDCLHDRRGPDESYLLVDGPSNTKQQLARTQQTKTEQSQTPTHTASNGPGYDPYLDLQSDYQRRVQQKVLLEADVQQLETNVQQMLAEIKTKQGMIAKLAPYIEGLELSLSLQKEAEETLSILDGIAPPANPKRSQTREPKPDVHASQPNPTSLVIKAPNGEVLSDRDILDERLDRVKCIILRSGAKSLTLRQLWDQYSKHYATTDPYLHKAAFQSMIYKWRKSGIVTWSHPEDSAPHYGIPTSSTPAVSTKAQTTGRPERTYA